MLRVPQKKSGVDEPAQDTILPFNPQSGMDGEIFGLVSLPSPPWPIVPQEEPTSRDLTPTFFLAQTWSPLQWRHVVAFNVPDSVKHPRSLRSLQVPHRTPEIATRLGNVAAHRCVGLTLKFMLNLIAAPDGGRRKLLVSRGPVRSAKGMAAGKNKSAVSS